MTDGLTQLDREVAAQAAQLELAAKALLGRYEETQRIVRRLLIRQDLARRAWEARN